MNYLLFYGILVFKLVWPFITAGHGALMTLSFNDGCGPPAIAYYGFNSLGGMTLSVRESSSLLSFCRILAL